MPVSVSKSDDDDVYWSSWRNVADSVRETPSIVRVRIGVREAEDLAVLAGVDFGRDAIARAHEVAVHEAAVQQERLRFGVADAAAELARQAFLDLVVDVDEVGRARHRVRLDLDLLDERQALQALLGALDRGVREVAAFHLAHFAAQHVVVDAGACR